MPTIQTVSVRSDGTTFVGFSTARSSVTSSSASVSTSASANTTANATPARPTHAHRPDMARPVGSRMSRSRKNPLGATSDTDQ